MEQRKIHRRCVVSWQDSFGDLHKQRKQVPGVFLRELLSMAYQTWMGIGQVFGTEVQMLVRRILLV